MKKKIIASIITLLLTGFLIIGLSDLADFGSAESKVYNEVTEYYLEKSIEETGAVNAVAGMILDYRAFDTFIEATVIFTALLLVIMLLQKTEKEEWKDDNDYR